MFCRSSDDNCAASMQQIKVDLHVLGLPGLVSSDVHDNILQAAT
jgi:hypothetical protein